MADFIGERSFGRGAVVGDKTIVDALAPCVDSWLASASNEEDMKTVQKQQLKEQSTRKKS
ncbi:TPA: DAK2 domain-containing protein [Bacillus pacificus]|nr:DAK2 domain-containing protein [Bacillus pacificus]HDR3486908.1 DAK2 domain-containing protein [Bacillus pacificus]HDR7247557.1 DAK2 domain-containing protein [Bacillus pacificus]HDR7932826.1 DAK2 domain-containing protein [Bacillus pacificus]